MRFITSCQVYGDNEMSDGKVRKWVWMFNEGRENMHDEASSGRPSLVNDDLVCKVNQRMRDNRHFTMFRCYIFTIIREHINLCLLKLELLK